MSTALSSSFLRLHPNQVSLAIEKTLPLNEKDKALSYAQLLSDKVNAYFQDDKLGEKRFSKKSKEDRDLPFSFWAKKSIEGFSLHFIPNTSLVRNWKGTFKKVKESFFLEVSKEALPQDSIAPEETVCYRIQKNRLKAVQEGLQKHKEIIDLFGEESYFPVLPKIHPLFRGKKGSTKCEMVAPRYKGNLDDGDPAFLGIVQRLACCLDITRGLGLLKRANPPIIHGDIKPNNFLLDQSNRALISDFDLTELLVDRFIKKEENTIFRYRSFIDRKGYRSLQIDLYSLVISIGEILILGLKSFNKQSIYKKSLLASFQNQQSLIRYSYDLWKNKVPALIQNDIESIFNRNSFNASQVSRELLEYAKRVECPELASSINETSLELAIFDPIFQFLLRVFKLDENSQKEFLEGKSCLDILETLQFPDTSEIEGILEECQRKLTFFKGSRTLSNEVSKEEEDVDKQTLYEDQIFDLVSKVLPENSPNIAFQAQRLIENANAYLKSNQLDEFEFRFKKEASWGVGHSLPFSGMIRKDKEGIFLYLIPRSEDTHVQRDSCLKIKTIWFSHIPIQLTENSRAIAQRALCLKVKGRNFCDINNWIGVQEIFNQNELAKMSLASLPFHVSVYSGKKDIKMELYDTENQSTLEMMFDNLKMQEKKDVYLNILDSIDLLHQENLIHRNIKPGNILLSFKEAGGIRARLADFMHLQGPGLSKIKDEFYLYWNYGSKNGYVSKESDIYSFMMMIKLSLWGWGKEHLEKWIKELSQPLQDQIRETWKETGGFNKSFFQRLSSLVKVESESSMVKNLILESREVMNLLNLIEEVENTDRKIKDFVKKRGGFTEEVIKKAFIKYPFPLISKIRDVLNMANHSAAFKPSYCIIN